MGSGSDWDSDDDVLIMPPRPPTEARRRAWAKANRKRSAQHQVIAHGVVYKLTSPSGKSYIGITKYSIQARLRWHKSPTSPCVAIRNALLKYGVDAFATEVLHSDVPLADLPALEIAAIAAHRTVRPSGYNISTGGQHNSNEHPESRQKIASAKRAYWQAAGANARTKAAENMQRGDARSRATATRLHNGLQRVKAKATEMDPVEGAKYLAAFLRNRAKKQQKYLEFKGSGAGA
jgi:hypothetical protein